MRSATYCKITESHMIGLLMDHIRSINMLGYGRVSLLKREEITPLGSVLKCAMVV